MARLGISDAQNMAPSSAKPWAPRPRPCIPNPNYKPLHFPTQVRVARLRICDARNIAPSLRLALCPAPAPTSRRLTDTDGVRLCLPGGCSPGACARPCAI